MFKHWEKNTRFQISLITRRDSLSRSIDSSTAPCNCDFLFTLIFFFLLLHIQISFGESTKMISYKNKRE